MMRDRLASIRTNLGRHRARLDQVVPFGAELHEYRLAPASSPATLDALERDLGIQLPEEYRAFLTGLGNGGAGPGYGLQRLALPHSEEEIPKAHRHGSEQVVVTRPGVAISRRVSLDAQGRRLDHHDLAFWDGARHLFTDPKSPSRVFPCTAPVTGEDPPSEVDHLLVPDGTLLLADYGCAIQARLVLDGPFRGDVWVLDGSYGAYLPFGVTTELHGWDSEPNGDLGARVGFLEWYEDWLNRHAPTATNDD